MVRFELFGSSGSGTDIPEPGRGAIEEDRTSSLRLAVASPDRRLIYSLVSKCIFARKLPLATDADPPVARFQLPSSVCRELEIDEPIELLAVDGIQQVHQDDHEASFTYLCLYTRVNVFLIKIRNDGKSSGLEMIPDSDVTYPLQSFMEKHFNRSVVRIRAAPQTHQPGNAVAYSPRGSFAVLLEDRDAMQQYVMVLYHHESDQSWNVPLQFGLEDLDGTRVVDFCFAESDGLSLMSATSVLLLQESGDVLSASPIVFDGMQVWNRSLEETLSYLSRKMEAVGHGYKWRQCKAAHIFFTEVFHRNESRLKAATVRILSTETPARAGSWPTKIQGPIHYHDSSEGMMNELPFASIEPFDSTESMVGLALARPGGKVDFIGFTPTTLLPRFVFEKDQDGTDLDDAVFKQTAVVEKVDLGLKLDSVCLITDPSSTSLVHLATHDGVYTISTNAMLLTTKKLLGPSNDSLSTTAWNSLSSGSNGPIYGVIVSSDPVRGHKVVANFPSGSFMTGDITRSKYDREFSTLFSAELSEEEDRVLSRAADAQYPLYQELVPVIEAIKSGLGNMVLVKGSSTSYKDISPEVLAWVAERLDKCNDEVTLPVEELNKIVAAFRPNLERRLETQRTQVQSLSKQVTDAISKLTKLEEQIREAKENASILSERSVQLYGMCEKLAPQMTPAERDFCRSIERLSLKTQKLEESSRKAREAAEVGCVNLQRGISATVLEDDLTQINLTLKGSGKTQMAVRDYLQTTASPKKSQLDDTN